MSAWAAFFVIALGMSAGMAGLWLVERRRLEADIVDFGWTVGLGLAALVYAALVSSDPPVRRWLIAGMVMVWSGRLALHLWPRVWESGEDGRYRTLRARWGADAATRFFLFFQAQGLSVALLSLHYLLAMRASDRPPGTWDAVAVAIWACSILGESIADRQLARFRADPSNRGRVCRRGLWKYSRHPNYFFEWLGWLAYVPFTLGTPWWPLSLVAPGVMLALIWFVTGIPPTEEQALRSRGEAYREYQRTTSPFIPWPPRERSRG